MLKKANKSLHLFPEITNFYYLLLKSSEISEPFAIIMILLSFSQSLSFIISSSYIIGICSDELSSIIYHVISIFRPLYIINTLHLKSLYQFLLALSFFYMIFYIIVIILIMKKSKKMPLLLKIFKKLTYMNFYLWYIPLNEVLLTPVYCLSVDQNTNVTQLFDYYLCIGGYWDVILGLVGVLLWIIMMLTCLMNVLFCVDMTYNVNNALAKSDSLMEIFTFLNKNLLIILLIFIRQLQEPVFFLIFLLLLETTEIFALKEFFQKPNFFNQKIDYLYGVTLSMHFFVSTYILCYTIFNVFGAEWSTGLPLLLSILLPLKLYKNILKKNSNEFFKKSFEELKTAELIDKKLKKIYSYLRSQEYKNTKNAKKKTKFNIYYNKNDDIILYVWGFIFGHWRTCTKTSCFCHKDDDKLFDYNLNYEYRTKKDNAMKNFQSLIYMKYFVRQQYKDAIFFLKNPVSLRLNLAYFNFFQLGNTHQALLEAFELTNSTDIHVKQLNFRKLFLIKRLEMEIRDLITSINLNKEHDQTKTTFNIERILQYEENFTLMQQKISEFRIFYTKFFAKLSNNSISLEELEKDCEILYSLRNQIEEIFDSLKDNPRSIKLYIGYLNNLIFKNDQGYALERKLKELLDKIHANEGQNKLFYEENLLYTESCLIIQVGGEYKNLGKVLKSNLGSVRILGYQPQELEYGNISMILPLRLKRFHDSFLEKYMKTGKNHILYKENNAFVRRKNGFVLNVAMVIKPSYDFQNSQFKFISFLRPLKRHTEYIVTDMFGTIDGMTENLSKLFNVQAKDYESGNFYIQVLCPKLYSFFIERSEKVHGILMDGSRNSSVHTNRTNKTRKFKEVEDLDLMELLDIPKTLSNEAILRFYRYNHGDLFGDLRSIINNIIEKLRKKKIQETNEGFLVTDDPNSPKGMDKWNLIKRKFIKIAMLGNFFNCKTRISYLKSSDHQYEWLVFAITEIEFTRKLKIMQMAKQPPTGATGGGAFTRQASFMDQMSYSKVSDQYDPNVFSHKAQFNTIMNQIGTESKVSPMIPRNAAFEKPLPIIKNLKKKEEGLLENEKEKDKENGENHNETKGGGKHVQYIKEFATTGIEKIVIHHEEEKEEKEDEDPEEKESLIIPTDSSLNIEGLLQDRISTPVDEARKGLDTVMKKSQTISSPARRKYTKSQTKSLGKQFSYIGGKTFDTLNSNDFANNLLVPKLSIDLNPFVEFEEPNKQENMPFLPLLDQPEILPEEDEDKLAENIINFTGNQLFEEKSEDMTEMNYSASKKTSSPRRKSIKLGGNVKSKRTGARARFDDVEKEASSPVNNKSPKAKGVVIGKKEADAAGTVNKEDLKLINKTLKDISKGLVSGADSDDSEKKTVKSGKMGARTIRTIQSMTKRTNMNLPNTSKTHKLMDILRDTIVKKLALDDNAEKKEKAYEQSVHSSISSVFQSHRLTEKAILYNYLPKSFKRLQISLVFLVILIFVLQISIYLIIVNLYDGFRDNLEENVKYNNFSNKLLQTVKGVFMYTALQKEPFSQTGEKSIYEVYLFESLQNELTRILELMKGLQLDYQFFKELSPDIFTKRSYYNVSISTIDGAFVKMIFELLKAVTLYCSELQKLLASESYSLPVLLQNIFTFSSELESHDNFEMKRNNLISYNKIVIMSILVINSTLIFFIFILRMYSHVLCYKYLNNLLEMLAKINFEDVETLKAYYLSISSVYDLQQESKGVENNNNFGAGFIDNPKSSKDNQNNKNRSHRLVDLKFIKTPFLNIFLVNTLFVIFIIGINLIVVLLSHGFDTYFEESGELQRHLISQFNFRGYSNSFLFVYDRKLSLGVYNLSNNQILNYLNDELITHSINESSYNFQNSFVTEYLQIIANEPLCSRIEKTNSSIIDCQNILKGLLLNSLINFELEALNKFKVMTLESVNNETDLNNFLEWGKALDYALLVVDSIKKQYVSNEKTMYDSEINILIIINCFSIICSFIIICVYYWFNLRRLARRLGAVRKIYLQIPIAILLRQKRIKKYLQDTSKFYLGN